jgi:hypothetical protein
MRQSPLLLSILAALSACSNTERGKACLSVPEEQTTCPAAREVNPSDLFTPDRCGWDVTEVVGEGKRETLATQGNTQLSACCYPAELVEESPGCAIGRPYFDDGTPLVAPLCSTDRAAPSTLSARAQAWALAGSGEHASVAAFSRLALQLLKLGAPNDLLRDVHQAALDELGHADLCWALARHFGAERIRVGAFPFPDSIALNVDLATLAAASTREGCLAETLGAHVVTVAAELAPEPEVQAALHRMAREEAGHAVLSFRIVAWALRAGGADVKSAVSAVLAGAWPQLDLDELAVRTKVDVALLRAAAQQGIAEVLRPAAAELLAAA